MLQEQSADAPAPDQEAERNEEIGQVRDAVNKLPDDYRQPLLLVRFQGLSYKDAAEALDLTIETIRMRLHRAHLQLAETLKR